MRAKESDAYSSFLHAFAEAWHRVRKRFTIWVGVVLAAGLFEIRHADTNAKVLAITTLILGAMVVVIIGRKLGFDKE